MKILIIEDDTFFQKFYALKLHEKNIDVAIASNGEEGLQKMLTFQPDLILLDLIMPVKNGFEVLEAVSQNENLKRVPILVFSTLGQEQDILKAKSLGAADFVNKSFFDFENLYSKIQTIVTHIQNTQKTQ